MYNLNSPESQKTGEATRGILSPSIMRHIPDDHPYYRCIMQCRQYYGEHYYPGSPAIAQLLLRADDQLHLMEYHPQEHSALKKNLYDLRRTHHRAPPSTPRNSHTAATHSVMTDEPFHNEKSAIHVHYRNGYEGVLAIAPPTPRRGLVFIDPSYEIKTEYLQVAAFSQALEKKWSEACIMIWYPLLSEGYHTAMLQALAIEQRTRCHHSVWPIDSGTGSLRGSGLLIINLPFNIARPLDFCTPDFCQLVRFE